MGQVFLLPGNSENQVDRQSCPSLKRARSGPCAFLLFCDKNSSCRGAPPVESMTQNSARIGEKKNPLFTLGSIYSTNANGAEQMPETINLNQID